MADPIIDLKHLSTIEIVNTFGDFSRCKTFGGFTKIVNNCLDEHYPVPVQTEDDENEEFFERLDAINKKRDKLKGDVFEVFGEYLIKTNSTHRDIAISDYAPITDDMDLGVDGTGVGRDGCPATVQFKYRSNPTEPLVYRDLATYGNDSHARYGILSQSAIDTVIMQLREADCPTEYFEALKPTGQNMLVISTSTRELYYTMTDVNDGVRHFGGDRIAELVNGNAPWWKGFTAALNKASSDCEIRKPAIRWKNQEEAKIKLKDFFAEA